MHKFTLINIADGLAGKEDLPVLYKLIFGQKYYVHKGKKLEESAEKLLDDVFRGIRGKKFPEAYKNIVKHCLQFPSLHIIKTDVIFNGEPGKLLKKEAALYKAMVNDDHTLNNLDIEPYKPEWMLKAAFQDRCENCLKTGLVNGRKVTFKFCPQCGRIIKPS